MRDLPRTSGRNLNLNSSNLDHIWLTRDQMLSLIPENPVVGEHLSMSKKISNRLARYHFLDSVRGEAEPFAQDHVKQADVKLTVSKVTDQQMKFKISGRCRTDRPPNQEKNPYTGNSIRSHTGYDLLLYGIAEFDRQQEQFVRFDLLAVGDRWGGSMYNFRDEDLKPSPIGFAFQLIEDVAKNPTPPRFYFSD